MEISTKTQSLFHDRSLFRAASALNQRRKPAALHSGYPSLGRLSADLTRIPDAGAGRRGT
jgi:hypothetical protein